LTGRDFISEIIEIRERRNSNSSYSETFSRLNSLNNAFNILPINDNELLKYFPIALVAAMEGGFRVMLTELIDHGSPFLDNCDKLLKNQKISFELIKALHGQRVSVGEFFSHVVSINKLPDINSIISTVISKDFLKELEEYCSRWDHEVKKKDKSPVISDPKKTYKYITRTFELRHIFCHESATKVKFDRAEIEQCLYAVTIFLEASTGYIDNVISPNSPLTQLDHTMQSSEKLHCLLRDIDVVENEIMKKIFFEPKRIKQLQLAREKWEEYREVYSEFCADSYEGGSIWPQAYNEASQELANSYLETLKKELEQADKIYQQHAECNFDYTGIPPHLNKDL
jgi:hypothetical protein